MLFVLLALLIRNHLCSFIQNKRSTSSKSSFVLHFLHTIIILKFLLICPAKQYFTNLVPSIRIQIHILSFNFFTNLNNIFFFHTIIIISKFLLIRISNSSNLAAVKALFATSLRKLANCAIYNTRLHIKKLIWLVVKLC